MSNFTLGWSKQDVATTNISSAAGIFVGFIRDIVATTRLLTEQDAKIFVSINEYDDGRWSRIYKEIGGRSQRGPRDFIVDKKMTREQIKAALLSAE